MLSILLFHIKDFMSKKYAAPFRLISAPKNSRRQVFKPFAGDDSLMNRLPFKHFGPGELKASQLTISTSETALIDETWMVMPTSTGLSPYLECSWSVGSSYPKGP